MKKTIILLMLLGLAVQGIQAQEIILRPDNIDQVLIAMTIEEKAQVLTEVHVYCPKTKKNFK